MGKSIRYLENNSNYKTGYAKLFHGWLEIVIFRKTIPQ